MMLRSGSQEVPGSTHRTSAEWALNLSGGYGRV